MNYHNVIDGYTSFYFKNERKISFQHYKWKLDVSQDIKHKNQNNSQKTSKKKEDLDFDHTNICLKI